MSKRKQIENLAAFIGLTAAHKILIEMINKQESIKHLEHEADTYTNLSFKLAEGNWNKNDIENIKELAVKRCSKKLETYRDIKSEKYNKIEQAIRKIMIDLGLV